LPDCFLKGAEVKVPLETIPNFQIGRVGLRHKLNVMFPHMHTRSDRRITPDEVALFFEDCLRPAFLEVLPERTAEFPVNYRLALLQAKTAKGFITSHEIEIPDNMSLQFFNNLQSLADRSIPAFHGIYFVHTIRGVKNSTLHNPESADERIRAMSVLLSDFDFEDLDQTQWWVDVGLEISAAGRSVHWLRNSHRDVLEWLFPNIDEGELQAIFGNDSRYWADRVATSDDIAGFRAIPQQRLARAISYIQAYSTEKAATYQLHSGLWRKRAPKNLLPGEIRKLLKDISEFTPLLRL